MTVTIAYKDGSLRTIEDATMFYPVRNLGGNVVEYLVQAKGGSEFRFPVGNVHSAECHGVPQT